MHAHRIQVMIAADHRLSVDLPDDFPSGLAEVIVLVEPANDRKVVRMSGVLSRQGPPILADADPIAEALDEQRRERVARFDRGEGGGGEERINARLPPDRGRNA